MPRQELCRGTMLASAAGDALGAPVEFLGIEQIVDAFGSRGIQDLVPAYGRLGAVTDDTQMAIATARGLVNAMRSGSDEVDAVLEAYFAWLDSLRDPANVRGPGSTCVGGLEEQFKARTACAENDSKGCGGVMRVHPVGLYLPGDPEAAYELGRRTADLTHGHPTSGVSSGAQAALVSQLVVGVSVLEAIGTLLEMLGDRDENLETLAAVHKALDLGMQGAPGREAMSVIGEGWIAEEALAAGVYVLVRYADAPLDGLVTAVNHSGDSDSTGAIAGALLGALRGGEWLPGKWLEVLEHREVLEELAGELAGLDP